MRQLEELATRGARKSRSREILAWRSTETQLPGCVSVCWRKWRSRGQLPEGSHFPLTGFRPDQPERWRGHWCFCQCEPCLLLLMLTCVARHVCMHFTVLIRTACSALLLVGCGDMELQQPCLAILGCWIPWALTWHKNISHWKWERVLSSKPYF